MTDPTPQPPPDPGFTAEIPSDPPAARLLASARKRHENLTELLARGKDPAATADADLVHDLRVGSRRLGEVARLLGAFLEKPTAKAVAASLKSLRHAMGDLRDSDVTREHLLKWRIPGPLKKVAAEIAANLEDSRPALQAAAHTQITSASLAGSMVILARVLEDHALPTFADSSEAELQSKLGHLIKSRERALRRSFGTAAKKQTATSLHVARIEVKKLRYLLEMAADAGTFRGVKRKVTFLKQLQQLLGDHHDTHVITEQLAAHLKDRREKPITGLYPAWRKWQRQSAHLQAKRASVFFAKTYAWINS